MSRLIILSIFALLLISLAEARLRANLDFSWRFHLGDITDPNVTTLNYPDQTWRLLDIPHDFVVEGTFNPKADKSHGYLPYGIGWYRKHFTLPMSYSGSVIWIDFDGTYRNADVYLNGFKLGNHPSGYTSYRYYISNVSTLRYGQENVIAVRCDATQPEGWWYDGGGIYRHVWINVANPVHVEPWGVYVQSSVTSAISNNGSPTASASVVISTQLINWANDNRNVILQSVINYQDKPVGTTSTSINFKSTTVVSQTISIDKANLWDINYPNLYTLTSTILENNVELDSVETTFGIRKIQFDVDKGFFLNDNHIKIKGMANHQDFAGVGTAVPDSLQYYRVNKLKEMNGNAWRTAHNPPNPELLDACDELGFLVWDENHYLLPSLENQEDLRSMILRDRNHPSIILWSLCNEALCMGEGSEQARQVGTLLKSIILQYDRTRPVTAAMNGGWGSGLSYVIDVQGFNYAIGEYDSYHRSHPAQPIIGSETASAVSDRGIYQTNATLAYVSAYDVNYPGWGATSEVAWTAIANRPFMAGSFAWTGFDYKGEPTPYAWPNINSHFGNIDIAGFPKDSFYYYKTWWGNRTELHLFPHWNWEGKQGQNIEVWVYSNAYSVELFLNDKSLGRQTMPVLQHVRWEVPYAPGTLLARGYDEKGVSIASQSRTTTGNPASIELLVEWGTKGLIADGQDVALIQVSALDEKGMLVPTSSNLITFSISGPGKIIGVGNGDPSSHEPDKATYRSLFNGLARVIVQSERSLAGDIILTATSPGLSAGRLTIHSSL